MSVLNTETSKQRGVETRINEVEGYIYEAYERGM